MKIVANKIISTLATFTLIASMSITFVVLNVAPESTLELHADGPTSEYSSYLGQTVNFCGNQWDVIGIKDGAYVAGSSAADGTIAEANSAMLLLHNGDSFGNITVETLNTEFNSGDNTYDSSTIQAKMAAQADLCSEDVTSAIFNENVKDTTLNGGSTDYETNDAHLSSETSLEEQKFFPLSLNEANAISTGLLAFSGNWWLRSPGESGSNASFVSEAGDVSDDGDSVENSSYLARPALQISLDSIAPFGIESGSKITLANRKYDLIGAGDQYYVYSVDKTALPVIGDTGTVTLLYSNENIDDAATPAADTDKTVSLQTAFKSDGTTNAYDGSTLQTKLNGIYSAFGDIAKSKIIPRTLPFGTQTPGGEAYGEATITDQALWTLSADEATDTTGDFRVFSDDWWLRSPGSSESNASTVNAVGTVETTGNSVSSSLLARPALQIPQNSTLLQHLADGTNATSLGSVTGTSAIGVGQSTEAFTATALHDTGAYTHELTWTSSNPAAATVVAETGIVTGVSELADNVGTGDAAGATKICAETADGEFKRCTTLQVLQIAETPSAEVDFADETITTGLTTGEDNYVYCVDTTGACTPSNTFSGADDVDLSTFALPHVTEAKKLRIALVGSTGETVNSDPLTLDIPARPAAPGVTIASVTKPTDYIAASGYDTSTMEYSRSDTSTNWTSDAFPEITAANANGYAYKFRLKATESAFKSAETAPQSVSVGTNTITVDTPTLAASTAVNTGYTLSWTESSDFYGSDLRYTVKYSTTNEGDWITNGTVVEGCEQITDLTCDITGLSNGTAYYVNVVVEDAESVGTGGTAADSQVYTAESHTVYSVTFSGNDATANGTVATRYLLDTTIVGNAPNPAPEKTGYDFAGWYNDTSAFTGWDSATSANLELTAHWQEIRPVVSSSKIKINYPDETIDGLTAGTYHFGDGTCASGNTVVTETTTPYIADWLITSTLAVVRCYTGSNNTYHDSLAAETPLTLSARPATPEVTIPSVATPSTNIAPSGYDPATMEWSRSDDSTTWTSDAFPTNITAADANGYTYKFRLKATESAFKSAETAPQSVSVGTNTITVGTPTLAASSAVNTGYTLTWTAANNVYGNTLRYTVKYSTTTVDNWITGGTAVTACTRITTLTCNITGLSNGTAYYVNVMVEDAESVGTGGTAADSQVYTAESHTVYSVTFNGNGATSNGTVATRYLLDTATVGVAPTSNPEKTGYDFAGWYNVASLFSGWSSPTSANLTLTAHWQEIQPVVSSSNIKINYPDETIEGLIAGTYHFGDGTCASDNTVVTETTTPYIADWLTTDTLDVYRCSTELLGGNETYHHSAAASTPLTLSARPAAPNLTATQPLGLTSAQGSITYSNAGASGVQYCVHVVQSNDCEGFTATWTDFEGSGVTGTIETLNPGTYYVRTKATDTAFKSEPATSVTLTRPIVAALPPSISNQPAASANYQQNDGAPTALSVTATSPTQEGQIGTLSYQWYYNTSNSTDTSGATSLGSDGQTATYTPSTAAVSNRWYFVVITNTNSTLTGTTTNTVTSNAAQVTVVEITPTATIDYINEVLTGLVNSATYSVGGTAVTAGTDGKIDIATNSLFDKSGIIKTNADSALNSASQALTIPARLDAPAGISATHPTQAVGNGTLTGTTTLMEYNATSADATTGWVTASETSTTLAPGTYYVRTAATGSNFHSAATSAIVIKPAYTVTLNLNEGSGAGNPASTYAITGEVLADLGEFAAPTRAGYTFNGYTKTQNGSDAVFSASGATVASVDGYTDSDKKWIPTEGKILYAKWVQNVATVNYSNCDTPANFSKVYDSATTVLDATELSTFQTNLATCIASHITWNTAATHTDVSVDTTHASFTFTQSGVGSPVTLNIADVQLVGTNTNAWALESTTGQIQGVITQKTVTIQGVTADSKTYDGNNTAVATGTAVINGNLDGGNLTVVPGTATFDDKNVGTSKIVTFSSYSLTGSAANNYQLTSQPAALANGVITPKPVTITGVTADSKTYDGNNTAVVTGTAVINGNLDDTNLTVESGTATFDNKNAGTSKTVTFSGYSLAGDAVDNYELTGQPAALTNGVITQKTVTIQGVTADSKTYDGNNTAVATGTAVIDGNLDGGNLTVNSTSATATFDNKNAGTSKTVTFSGYSLAGSAVNNYELTGQPASLTNGVITQKTVTITGLTAANKEYDGNNTAVATGTAVINGNLDDTNLTVVSGTATFSDISVQNDKTVTFSGYSLSGDAVNNYELTDQPASATANITQKEVTVTWDTTTTWEYDRSSHVPTATVENANGLVGSEVVTVVVTGTQTNVGDYTATAESLGGTNSANYKLPSTLPTQAFSITAKPLTWSSTGTVNSKSYDKTTTATPDVSPTLVGIVAGDTVDVSAGTVAFNSINANASIGVTASGWGIANTGNYANYSVADAGQPVFANGVITQKTVTITGLTAANKEYDGNNTAVVTGTAVINGNLDDTNLTVNSTSATATFDSSSVDDDKTVTFSGYSLSGDAVNNYELTGQPASATANITQKEVTVTWGTTTTWQYDRSSHVPTATVENANGLVGSEVVTVVVTDDQTNVGDYTATADSLGGANSANYKLPETSPTQAFSITAKPLTWSSTGTVNSKSYDKTTTATPAVSPTLVGIVAGDTVDVSAGTVAFNSMNANASIGVTASGWGIANTGNYANYSIADAGQPVFANGVITQKTLTITGGFTSVARKYIASDVSAQITGSAEFVGVESGDTITATASDCTATFADDTVGDSKVITIICTLQGGSAGNYTVAAYTELTGVILNYEDNTVGDIEVTVPAGSTPGTDGDGHPTITIPGGPTDEYEIDVDGVDVTVPGSSVIHDNGTVSVPAGDVTIDSVTVNVPAESVVDVAAGTIIVPEGDVTIGETDVTVPAESVVDVAAGTITVPAGDVTIGETDVTVPAGSVVDVAAGTITVPAGDVTIGETDVTVPAESVVDVAAGTITVPAGDVTIGETDVTVPAGSVVDVEEGTILLPGGDSDEIDVTVGETDVTVPGGSVVDVEDSTIILPAIGDNYEISIGEGADEHTVQGLPAESSVNTDTGAVAVGGTDPEVAVG
jgi:uncharacterized repeat protein (TIGR02543 family)